MCVHAQTAYSKTTAYQAGNQVTVAINSVTYVFQCMSTTTITGVDPSTATNDYAWAVAKTGTALPLLIAYRYAFPGTSATYNGVTYILMADHYPTQDVTQTQYWMPYTLLINQWTGSTNTSGEIYRNGEVDLFPTGITAPCTNCSMSQFTNNTWTLTNNAATTALQSSFTPGQLVLNSTITGSPQLTLNNSTGLLFIATAGGTYNGLTASLDNTYGLQLYNASPQSTPQGKTTLNFGQLAMTYGATPKTASTNILSLSNATKTNTFNIDGTTMNLTSSGGITAAALTIPTLTINSAVYTNASKMLTTTAPSTGTIGYWSRMGTTLSPLNAVDAISTTGNITAGSFTTQGTSTFGNTSVVGNLNTYGNFGCSSFAYFATANIADLNVDEITLGTQQSSVVINAGGILLNTTQTDNATYSASSTTFISSDGLGLSVNNPGSDNGSYVRINNDGTMILNPNGGNLQALSIGNSDEGSTFQNRFTVSTYGDVVSQTETITGLAPSSAVYTDASNMLTTKAPTSGTVGVWNRDAATAMLSPATATDNVTLGGNITLANGSGNQLTLSSSSITLSNDIDPLLHTPTSVTTRIQATDNGINISLPESFGYVNILNEGEIDIRSAASQMTAFSIENEETGKKLFTVSATGDVVSQTETTNKLNVTGSVAIGTPTIPSGYLLAVAGPIIATQVSVNLVGTGKWVVPDYVFGKSYKLPLLKDVEMYVKANSHLSEVPSEKEITKDGLDLAQMNIILLKKVEELTLYLIEQNKKIEQQSKDIESLKNGK